MSPLKELHAPSAIPSVSPATPLSTSALAVAPSATATRTVGVDHGVDRARGEVDGADRADLAHRRPPQVLPLVAVEGVVGPLVLGREDREPEVGAVGGGQLDRGPVALGDEPGAGADDPALVQAVHHRHLHLVEQARLDQLPDDDVRAWQLDLERVALDDLDHVLEPVGAHGVAQRPGQHGVDLDRDHPRGPRGRREQRQDAGPGAHLDDHVAGPHHRLDGRPERQGALPVDQAQVGVVGVGPDDAGLLAQHPSLP